MPALLTSAPTTAIETAQLLLRRDDAPGATDRLAKQIRGGGRSLAFKSHEHRLTVAFDGEPA